MKKKVRQEVIRRFGGRCAYCGQRPTSPLQVDHVFPRDKWFQREMYIRKFEIPKNVDDPENLQPACARCNRYKSNMLLEDFRRQVSLQVERARSYSWNFRLAEDFGLVREVKKKKIVFYFEKVQT